MEWRDHLKRWTDAGLIDTETAEAIRAFETGSPDTRRVRWPVILAVAFGGILLATGLMLFVSAHWDALSPFARIAVVMLALAALHTGGVFAQKFPALATTLHAVGTIGLGGAIAISGQVFNMNEHWPTAVLLWAIGAWAGAWVLRDIPQLVFASVLTPAWIVSEVVSRSEPIFDPWVPGFIALTALVYMSAARPAERSPWRTALAAVGSVALLPAAILTAVAGHQVDFAWLLLLPLPLAYALRRREAWPAAGWAVWSILQSLAAENRSSILPYLAAAAGSVALAAWGVAELRKERVNLGIAGFVLTVLFFYFVYFIDAVDRSLGLIGLGLLFLAGGWQLERVRRKLMRRIDGFRHDQGQPPPGAEPNGTNRVEPDGSNGAEPAETNG